MPKPLEERAREFLSVYLDMLDGLGTTKVNRDVHYAKLTALLTRVQAEARLAALEEAAKLFEKAFEQNWIVQDTLEAIRALAQAAAPATKEE